MEVGDPEPINKKPTKKTTQKYILQHEWRSLINMLESQPFKSSH